MAYGCTVTVQVGQMPSSQSGFVWLLTEGNFPTGAIDGGVNSIDNGGGNLRCYTDSTKTTQLPIEVVSFVTGGTPSAQVWGRSPNLGVGDTVYIEADTVATAQPAVTDTYGRNAVWVDYEAVLHMQDGTTVGPWIDSTGNGHDATIDTGSAISVVQGSPLGGDWLDFDTTQRLVLSGSNSLVNNKSFNLSIWINPDISDAFRGVFGNWSVSGVPDMTHLQSSTRRWSWDSDGSQLQFLGAARAVNQNYLISLSSDSSGMRSYDNGVLLDTQVGVGDALNCVNPFVIGSYFDNSQSNRYNGRATEARIRGNALGTDYVLSEYNNQSAPTSFWSTSAWVDQGGGGTSITVNDLTQLQTIDNITLTQKHTLAINEISQVQTIDNVDLTQGYVLSVSELSQNQTIDQITLVQAGVLVLDEVNQAQLISNLNLQSMTPITVQNLSQSQLLENVDITLLAELVQINDATQSQTIDGITLLQNSIIQIDSLSQSQLLQSINFGGVVVGYLEGELNIFYSLNGDILVHNAVNGETKTYNPLDGSTEILG